MLFQLLKQISSFGTWPFSCPIKVQNKNPQGENMIKKIFMIALYLMLGYQARAAVNELSQLREIASERSAAAVPSPKLTVCKMEAGDTGLVKFRAHSHKEAFEKVTESCFQRRQDKYIQSRGQFPDQDRQILFVESCANKIECV